MIKLHKLNEVIAKSGLKKNYISSVLGISDTSLRNKLSGKTGFTWAEIQALTKLLSLTLTQCNDIFFSDLVAEKATEEAM